MFKCAYKPPCKSNVTEFLHAFQKQYRNCGRVYIFMCARYLILMRKNVVLKMLLFVFWCCCCCSLCHSLSLLFSLSPHSIVPLKMNAFWWNGSRRQIRCRLHRILLFRIHRTTLWTDLLFGWYQRYNKLCTAFK